MLWIDTGKQLNKYFDHGSLPIITSVDKRHYDEKRYEFLLHGHSDICELTVITKGAGLYKQGNEAALVTRGDVLLYNCGELHVTQSVADEGVDYFSIGITNLRKKGLPADFLRNEEEPFLLHGQENFSVIENYCEQLYFLLSRKNKDSFNDLAVQLLGASLIVFLDQLEKDDSYINASKLKALGIKAYLDKNYRKNVTLALISAELGYSETFISHEFKKRYGIAPMKYVNRLRISEAQLLLHQTDLKVSEVARKVGFANSNYFITLFSREVGTSPEKYREVVKKDVRSLV
ncbi:MAG: AraC family transcriptional regulator [Lachnospiraceae bacterium]|nr:AraC family transcriptional regulator [Lachnospiraceae bacterium]